MECESKTKILPYFRTWCPCKCSNVVATIYDIEFNGVSVPEEMWEKMEDSNAKIIVNNPTVTDIV